MHAFLGINTIIKFCMNGVIVTLFHAVIALICMRLFLISPALSNGVAYILATLLSYFLHTIWSFSNPINKKNFARFICISLLGLTLSMLIAQYAELQGFKDYEGIILITLIVTPISFLFHRFWTYAKKAS